MTDVFCFNFYLQQWEAKMIIQFMGYILCFKSKDILNTFYKTIINLEKHYRYCLILRVNDTDLLRQIFLT